MKKLFFLLTLFPFILWNTTQDIFAAIDYGVTPIRYELDLQPGESITLPASIRNNSDDTVTLPTTSSDFQSSGPGGVPSLVRKSELAFPDQELSTWITLSAPSVTLAPGEEGTITFTIDVPITATPGGHYGAVLFRNPGSESSTSGNISINVDYGIIILVNVAGEVVVGAEIDDPIIVGGGVGGGGGTGRFSSFTGEETGSSTETPLSENASPNQEPDTSSDNPNQEETDRGENANDDGSWYIGTDPSGEDVYIYPDTCPLGDFTASKYDSKCFGNTEDDLFLENGVPKNLEEGVLFNDNFEVLFQFPIKNTGNTHIKPTGKIILKDENGVIKAIGKEIVANDRGAIIDQKIVDYVPINDQGGNILPQTKRLFESKWQGFPYKTFDDQGNPVVNYWSPSEYYTQQNKDSAGFLMFWERVSENRTQKDITADIELIYYDEEGNPIEFNTSKTFTVQYIEQAVSVNPYIILGLLLIFAAGLLIFGAVWWWFILFKLSPCWNCDTKIKSKWKTCPHCRVIQNKKKHKAFEKQKEDTILKTKVVKKPRKAPVKKKVSK